MADQTRPAKSDHLAATERAQSAASDPAASAWVSANAGAGKTHVLKMRVLRLLLAATSPERILCLTYTKAAAAEMSARVFADLGAWATMPDDGLVEALSRLVGRPPRPDETRLARQLFARAIETPGGLKVQTIHAFCERLLQRFPLEAGVPPGFEILDDVLRAELRREAIDSVLTQATRAPSGPLGRALATMIRYASDASFDEVLAAALDEKAWLDGLDRIGDGRDDTEAAIRAVYQRALGLDHRLTRDKIDEQLAGVLDPAVLKSARSALSAGKKSDQAQAAKLAAAQAAKDRAERIEALSDFFLTEKGEPRARLATKDVEAALPGITMTLESAQSKFAGLVRQRMLVELADATTALAVIGNAVLKAYGDAKTRRAALDYDDLIARTAQLLGRSEAAEWVLYKLDGGLEHILVDEAQDTSPQQWQVIEALAREFLSGEGAAERVRTLFAVGDEKQSIYSFQGAAPRMFAETGTRFADLAKAAMLDWRTVPLTLSFRTVAPLLEAVDRVFADAGRTPGLTAAAAEVRHLAHRHGHAGHIEIWPTEIWDDSEPTDAWAPLAETTTASPVLRLAASIADTIAGWIDNGERLQSEHRPIRAGDILILVRTRGQLAGALVAALKQRRIPVAGTDRICVTEQIAVQDLVALCEFLVLPEDDLALAAVLKSPLFGLDDDDLIRFAPQRKGSLWKALLEAARAEPRFAPAAEQLRRWRQQADFTPPFEFLAGLLDRDGMRARLLARLGAEASDPIDELLNLALHYDDGEPPSLQGFLEWLKASRREIKRDMEHGRNEVRIMTVHGAKGLEAPIVFLPDTCGPASGRPAKLVALADTDWPLGADRPLAWPVKGTSGLDAVRDGRSAEAHEDAEEHNRLLYVALTRARDRLYIAGYENRRGRARGCWYDTISDGLDGLAINVALPDGRTARRHAASQTMPAVAARAGEADEIALVALPPWATRKAPSVPQLTMPLAPSRLAPYEVDEEGEPMVRSAGQPAASEPSASSPALPGGGDRFLRGTITHALLEHLPTLPEAGRERAARAFVDARAQALPVRTRAGIVNEVLAILADPAFGAVFGPDSTAEVPIVAEIERPHGRGPALKIAGQIDRLARLGDDIVIIDYKTNRPPPQEMAQVAPAYLYQLAAYRLAVARIFATGKAHLKVRAAILWTDGARLMPISDDVLDSYERALWDLDAASLHGTA